MTPSHIGSVPSCRKTTIFEVRARLALAESAQTSRSSRCALRVRYAQFGGLVFATPVARTRRAPWPRTVLPSACPVLLSFPSADCLRVNACGFDVVGRLLLGGVSALGTSAGGHAALGLETAAVSPDKDKIAMFRAPTLAAAARIHWLIIPDIYLQRFMPNVNPRPLSYRPCGAVQRSADGRVQTVRATSPLAHTKSRSGDSAIMQQAQLAFNAGGCQAVSRPSINDVHT
ncbi:hypothetical protein C8R47DRAFT_1270019 [Mycena vitilis]|nr:hypothetical protein C8R47DRAFT_1270019 [Mycena vitilis]